MPGRIGRLRRVNLTFEFLGLVGLADPLRASVVEAVRECRSAGIKAVMITGDYPATAKAIARQAGLERGELVTGEELEKLSDAELARRVETATCFRADHAGAEASYRQRATRAMARSWR